MKDSPFAAREQKAVVASLSHTPELELAGVVRCTHCSLMVSGQGRIPIVAWLRKPGSI